MNDIVNNLIVIAGFEILDVVLKVFSIFLISYIILFVALPAYIQHVLFSDSLKALEQVVKKLDELEQVVKKLDKSEYKLNVALVHLENIKIILTNIDRRTHYRKIRGVPRD